MSSTPCRHLPQNPPVQPKTIVCCFDGTGNKFGSNNSNVARLFGALEKGNDLNQVVYYQPGIGTYTGSGHFSDTILSAFKSGLNQALAYDFEDHVKDGYKYIMDNYRIGDKICLFGFSRGAHTARVLMAMIYKACGLLPAGVIGIIPRGNHQQVAQAFAKYRDTSPTGIAESRAFKRDFAIPVTVDFVGVWDTVASVGAIPFAYPYTSATYAVKTFRHALALDERRARFRPYTWYEPTDWDQDLDADEPQMTTRDSAQDENWDQWKYEPPRRTPADVKEVWFAGTHADVGGGSHDSSIVHSLGTIALRWMLNEALLSGCDIRFDLSRLQEIEFDFVRLRKEGQRLGLELKFEWKLDEACKWFEARKTSTKDNTHDNAIEKAQSSRIYDQLSLAKVWRVLEILPITIVEQNAKGDWTVRLGCNLERGRHVPLYRGKATIHHSVAKKVEDTENPYCPQAANWDQPSLSAYSIVWEEFDDQWKGAVVSMSPEKRQPQVNGHADTPPAGITQTIFHWLGKGVRSVVSAIATVVLGIVAVVLGPFLGSAPNTSGGSQCVNGVCSPGATAAGRGDWSQVGLHGGSPSQGAYVGRKCHPAICSPGDATTAASVWIKEKITTPSHSADPIPFKFCTNETVPYKLHVYDIDARDACYKILVNNRTVSQLVNDPRTKSLSPMDCKDATCAKEHDFCGASARVEPGFQDISIEIIPFDVSPMGAGKKREFVYHRECLGS